MALGSGRCKFQDVVLAFFFCRSAAYSASTTGSRGVVAVEQRAGPLRRRQEVSGRLLEAPERRDPRAGDLLWSGGHRAFLLVGGKPPRPSLRLLTSDPPRAPRDTAGCMHQACPPA